MRYLKQLILPIFLIIFFSACANKTVTLKTLQPSKLNIKMHNIILENFRDDNINQTENFEDLLVNQKINNKNIFKVVGPYDDIDAIITGKVLKSSYDYDFYYDDIETYTRCDKRGNCKEYERSIPCERKDFKVKTQVKVLDINRNVLFSKIYKKSYYSNKCHRNHILFSRYFYTKAKQEKEKIKVNSELSLQIAKEALKDISPHFKYSKISIIKNLDDTYDKNTKELFENIVKAMSKNNIEYAQVNLHKLNGKLKYKSYQVLYNLALTFEVQHKYSVALSYYIKAKNICMNQDDLKLINLAINRIKNNIKNEKNALYQIH